jgi:hypothetical protein
MHKNKKYVYDMLMNLLQVPSMICTIVQISVQDYALVEIRRFHHNGTRNIVTLLSSLLASMVECMGLSPG